MSERRFTTQEAARLTGATPRQLQWWDEQRIVVAARDGRRRMYNEADLSVIVLIEELRVRHVSLQRIRKVLRFLRQGAGLRLTELTSGRAERHLLLDGRNIYLETEDRQIVNLLKNARQAVFVVCVSDAARRLQTRLEEFSSVTDTVTKKESGRAKSGARDVGKRAS